MFYNCYSLKSLNLPPKFKLKNSYINYMFNNCYNLIYINMSSFEGIDPVENIFNGCINLINIKIK